MLFYFATNQVFRNFHILYYMWRSIVAQSKNGNNKFNLIMHVKGERKNET